MNLFDTIKIQKPKKNVFDLSHEVKLTCNMGELVPFFCQDVVPGDKFRMNTELLLRMQPMLAPIMHRVNVFTHFFFVPNRLLWDNWENFITGGENGSLSPVFPRKLLSDMNLWPNSVRIDATQSGTLADYLGFPVIDPNNLTEDNVSSRYVSALPFRAYNLIYNEYYRDQNLMEPIVFSKDDGSDDITPCSLLKRCWEKDYFTSALPWTQRGGEALIPIGSQDIVTANGPSRGSKIAFAPYNSFEPSIGVINPNTGFAPIPAASSGEPKTTLVTEGNTATTINDLRRASKLQQWLERNARGGSRYIEQILSHFGVRSSDARLQRPEYLGGGCTPVSISEVLQTSSTDSTTPQGNMAGHGVSVGRSHTFNKYFEEHGIVIGIVSILPRTSYQDGIPKQFFKFDKFDYFFPEFAHLGEQEIKNKELAFISNSSNTLEGTFGYTPRYAEYKYIPSSVHGDFRNNLDFWHLGRKFQNQPLLNSSFVEASPSKRIFAVEDENTDSIIIEMFNNLTAVRPMPKYGTPML